MIRDVFYYGNKPNVHPREKFAKNLADARQQSVTEHFWIINEFCDYKDFDWEFDFDYLPDEDVWAQDHNNIWPSTHQKDSGTWLCPKEHSDILIYRADVNPIKRKQLVSGHWKLLDNVDTSKWDFSWHPDPTDPPYIYHWGCKFFPVEFKHVLEYHVENATKIKYMENIVELLPSECLKEYIKVDKNKFDISWRPDPRDEPYIYVWGNKYIPGEIQSTIEYHVPGATDKKYMGVAEVLPEYEKWHEYVKVDKTKFDMSWRPDPREPAYIYVWGNKYISGEERPTLEYHTPSAIERKYMGVVDLEPQWDRWHEYQKIDRTKFDLTWRPDNLYEDPYIYVWGNKYVPAEIQPTLEYHTPSAIERKYMGNIEVLPEREKWHEYAKIDKTTFDLTWRPDPREPPYIYVWGNKWIASELEPTITYTCDNATEIKYMSELVEVLPQFERWVENQLIDRTKFDMSWRPDPREPPYIYVWGNKYIPAEIESTLEYHCPNATERKYMGNIEVLPELHRWVEIQSIDKTLFDLSWRPDPREPPYIYVWGNKYIPGELQSTIEYHTPNAVDKKYMGDVVVTPETSRWNIIQQPKNFDLSWRPDPREPAYIYVWGNKHIPGELLSTIEYHTPNATEKKYVGEVEVEPEYERWNIVQQVTESFDLTWRPDPREPPYIYVWGNKYIPGELQPTIEYHTPNAVERKYMGVVDVLPENNWKITQTIDVSKFDLSWRPDPREPAYIYTWGNKYVPAEILPTLEYYCEGAIERKYMGDVEVIPEFNRWVEIQPIDKTKFDLTWRPDPREPPYIYIWGNKHISAELKSTLEYHTPGATDKKYVGNVEVIPLSENYKITQQVSNFDFTWRPDPREPDYIYVWGNKYIPGELLPTIEYYCPNAIERKYMGDVEVTPEWDKYKILIPVDKTSFDFAWRPDPREPPYIYVWGNQSNSAQVEPTIEYHCLNATERKYMNDKVAKTIPNIENYKVLINTVDFDYSWRPDPGSPPYIYVFGNQWHDAMTEPTVEYHTPGATDRKYITDIIAKVNPTQENWKTLIPVTGFDYSWRPNPHSSPYIYVFGNQWNPIELEHTVEYHVPGATDYKYITDIIAKLKPTNTEKHWKQLIPVESFDYSWRPDPREPALIYVFGNKWNDAKTEPTIEYHCEGATERKYLDFPVAVPQTIFKYWSISNNDDLETFDFSWRPNPFSQPQIYQWENNGPRYTVPEATEVVLMKRDGTNNKQIINRYYINTTLEQLINEHPDEVFWALNPDLNYDKFDFSWRPNEENFRHINVFGNQYSKNTHTYYVNGPMYVLGHREYNYVTDNIVTAETNLSMFFVDKGNKESNDRYEHLKDRYPNIQKTRYINSWVDTINRCINKSQTKLFWIVSSELDYNGFEFDFYPSPWQEKMVHVFGTQWSHWGNTYLINKETFVEDTKYVKIIEHLSCLNFVKTKRAKAVNVLYDTVLIDHGNDISITNKLNDKELLIVKYEGSYLETFKKVCKLLPEKRDHYIWVISSVCDYTDFDFSYVCDPFAKDQLHVFPSDKQKFGDTFLVDVNKLKVMLNEMNRLSDYVKINFNNHQTVKRISPPEFITEETHINFKNFDYNFPYAVFKTNDCLLTRCDEEPMNLWSNTEKNIIITVEGGSRVIIPKLANDYVKTELYDYPYIVRSKKLFDPSTMDIIFVSNQELCAESNYNFLQEFINNSSNKLNRIKNINGRTEALKAAATLSTTPWFFVVPGKLKIDKSFNFNYQPDRLQIPKHYIFNAINPVTGLTYGHQGMVLYNKNLVLNNNGNSLDFTMHDPHQVVDLISGTATGDTDNYSTWRTAFRECIKLNYYVEFFLDKMSKERLNIWLTVGNGKYGADSIKGANDALEFYQSVDGDLNELKKTYSWDFCKQYYDSKY
jgi:hypothetical protein